jgi:hypothetical protein
MPITYIFMCLPITAELAGNPTSHLLKLTPEERWRDYVRIAGVCAASALLCYVMAWRLR